MPWSVFVRFEAFATKHLKIYAKLKAEWKCYCPIHTESRPSFVFNTESGKWKCFSKCGGGTLITLRRKLKLTGPLEETPNGQTQESNETRYVAPSEVETAYRALRAKDGAEARKFLGDRGIRGGCLDRLRIGLGDSGTRIWIPITDGQGRVVNIKRYDWLKATTAKYLSYGEGYGSNRLWPVEVVSKFDELYLFEGEMDCLLAHALGVENAVTTTGGAGSWEAGFTRVLAGKKIRILYDIDDAGHVGAAAIARQLYLACPDLVVGKLPISFPDNGDFTDYARSVGFKREAIAEFLGSLSASAVSGPGVGLTQTLQGVVAKENFQKEVTLRAVVSGKDLTPYQIPNKIQITCAPNPNSKACAGCPLVAFGGSHSLELPWGSRAALASIMSSDRMVRMALDEGLEIPAKCPGHKITPLETVPAWEVVLVNDLDAEDRTDDEYIARRAVSFINLPPNIPHDFKALSTSDPKTQRALLQIKEATSSQTALQRWTTDGKEALLKIWEVGNGDTNRRLPAKKAHQKVGRNN